MSSSTDNEDPPFGNTGDENVVNLDERRKEDKFRMEMEELANGLAEAVIRACARSDTPFFMSTYLINGYVELTYHAKSNVIIKDRVKKIKDAFAKYPDTNARLVFEAAVKSRFLEIEAEKQRRLAELRENQKTMEFDDYQQDKYAEYDQKTGLPIPDLFNAQLAFKHCGVEGKYNLYKEEQTALYQGQPVDIGVLWNVIYKKTRVQWTMERLETALELFCKQKSYHPVKEYFDSIRHLPSKGLIENWMTVCLGAEDTPLNREIGKKMLVATVARTYQPGTKFDQMIVWEGPQGIGKSSLLEMICGSENFNSGKILDEENMKIAEALKGRMIYESSELVGHGKDIDKLKSMLSKTSDKGRWAYARTVKDHPRTAIIVGTTNRPTYLIDETGNRRFWPVMCGVVPTANMINGKPYVDFKWMEQNRDNLYAEALRLYETGYSLVLDNSLWPDVEDLQSERMTEVSGSEKVEDLLGFTEHEGLYITENTDAKIIELRIHTRHIIENLFPNVTGNLAVGKQVKAAVASYNKLAFKLRWIYKEQMKIGKRNNSGYIMTATGEAYDYLKEMVEFYRSVRRMSGISSPDNPM